MTAPVFANTVTVTVLRPLAKTNRGDPTGAPTPNLIPGCVVWPGASSEQVFQQDSVADTLNVLFPPGSDVTATDQVSYGGEVFDVQGNPDTYNSPFTSLNPGVLVVATRKVG